MIKDPAFLFYSSDFLTGTIFMTNEQVGIYVRLLCSQHQHGGIINKINFNSLVNGDELIKSKFVESEDGYYNERLMREMCIRQKKSNNISLSAKKAWESRKNGVALPSHKNRIGLPMLPEDENEVINYFKENGYKEDIARKAFRYYSEANWHDGKGKKIRNWKQKMQSVWFKDENKERSINQEPTIF